MDFFQFYNRKPEMGFPVTFNPDYILHFNQGYVEVPLECFAYSIGLDIISIDGRGGYLDQKNSFIYIKGIDFRGVSIKFPNICNHMFIKFSQSVTYSIHEWDPTNLKFIFSCAKKFKIPPIIREFGIMFQEKKSKYLRFL